MVEIKFPKLSYAPPGETQLFSPSVPSPLVAVASVISTYIVLPYEHYSTAKKARFFRGKKIYICGVGQFSWF